MARDADHHGLPKLMGYGKTDITEIMKKLFRDNYAGFISVDNQFSETVFDDEPKKVGFFKSIFSGEKKKKNDVAKGQMGIGSFEEMTGAHSAAAHNSFRFDQFAEAVDYRQEEADALELVRNGWRELRQLQLQHDTHAEVAVAAAYRHVRGVAHRHGDL